MKKNLIMVLITVLVFGGVCIIGLNKVKCDYNVQLEEVQNSYETQIKNMKANYEQEYSELEVEMDELQNQVYNYMETDDPYEITVRHDDELHCWYGDNKDFNKKHITVY